MEARAVWDFSGSAPGDLPFRSGDVVVVTNTGADFDTRAPTTPADGAPAPKPGWWIVS